MSTLTALDQVASFLTADRDYSLGVVGDEHRTAGRVAFLLGGPSE